MVKKWVKGEDFMDGSPRYTFDGRDPQDTLEDISVVIYTERELGEDYVVRNYYYGEVRHNPSETSDRLPRQRFIKNAKLKTEELFDFYVEKFKEWRN